MATPIEDHGTKKVLLEHFAILPQKSEDLAMTEKELAEVMAAYRQSMPGHWCYIGPACLGISSVPNDGKSSGYDVFPTLMETDLPVDWTPERTKQFQKDLNFCALAHQAIPAMFAYIQQLEGQLTDMAMDGGIEFGRLSERNAIADRLVGYGPHAEMIRRVIFPEVTVMSEAVLPVERLRQENDELRGGYAAIDQMLLDTSHAPARKLSAMLTEAAHKILAICRRHMVRQSD